MSVNPRRHDGAQDVGRSRAEIFENGVCGVMKRGGPLGTVVTAMIPTTLVIAGIPVYELWRQRHSLHLQFFSPIPFIRRPFLRLRYCKRENISACPSLRRTRIHHAIYTGIIQILYTYIYKHAGRFKARMCSPWNSKICASLNLTLYRFTPPK